MKVVGFAVAGMWCWGLIGFGKVIRRACRTGPVLRFPPGKMRVFSRTSLPARSRKLSVNDFISSNDGVIADDLGLDCPDCHPNAGTVEVGMGDSHATERDRAPDDLYGGADHINRTNFGGVERVTCWRPAITAATSRRSTIALDTLYESSECGEGRHRHARNRDEPSADPDS